MDAANQIFILLQEADRFAGRRIRTIGGWPSFSKTTSSKSN